jgi:glycine oxidase
VSPDVVVVGAGIVGCSVARRCAKLGARVVVIDPEQPGSGASWAAAGMLAPQAEAHASDDFFRLLLLARERYPSLVAELTGETGLDVGYRDEGLLLVAFNAADLAELEDRLAWQTAAGLSVEKLSREEARKLEPILSAGVIGALCFPGDHQVENRLLTRALWTSASLAGAEFRIGSPVIQVTRNSGGATIHLASGEVVGTETIVLAAGSWSATISGLPRRVPIEPVHGQLLAIDGSPRSMAHIIVTSRGYMVPRSDGRLIVGTTSDRFGFRASVTAGGLQRLTSVALEIAPDVADLPVVAHWSGLRPGTPDGLPILGRDPEFPALIYATGHYRNGILLGPLTGELIGSIACGQPIDVDLRPFEIARFSTL